MSEQGSLENEPALKHEEESICSPLYKSLQKSAKRCIICAIIIQEVVHTHDSESWEQCFALFLASLIGAVLLRAMVG